MEFINEPWFQNWIPLLIFFSRILDVSLGTLRIIFVSKGMRYLAPLIGFFEVLIWLIVISHIMQKMSSPIYYFAYAAGFAAGNYFGIFLENRLAMGYTFLRIITRTGAKELIVNLRELNYRVTHVPAIANSGKVEVIFLPTRRKEIPKLVKIVNQFNPNAIFTIEDMRGVSEDTLPNLPFARKRKKSIFNRLYRFKRKGK